MLYYSQTMQLMSVSDSLAARLQYEAHANVLFVEGVVISSVVSMTTADAGPRPADVSAAT